MTPLCPGIPWALRWGLRMHFSFVRQAVLVFPPEVVRQLLGRARLMVPVPAWDVLYVQQALKGGSVRRRRWIWRAFPVQQQALVTL